MAAPPVLDLNLASRPFRNNSLLWTGFVLGLVAVLALSVWNVQRYRTAVDALDQLRDDMSTYGARLADLERRNRDAKRGIEQHDLETMAIQTAKANDVISLKAFSWTTLFNRLEEILPYNVRMQRIRPIFRIGQGRSEAPLDAEERVVPIVVEGSAKELRAFLDFEAALLESPYFDGVEPERHEADNNEVDFALRFQYYPNRSPAEATEEATAEGPDDETAPSSDEGEEGAEPAAPGEREVATEATDDPADGGNG